MRYTTMIGDRDSKTYNAIVNLKPSGDDKTAKKAECVNHVAKRPGACKPRDSGSITKEKLNITLLELNCHLHPLDGLANAARSALKELDRREGKRGATFESDCCVAYLLYALSKLRYKAKEDSGGFKAFLRSRGKPCSTFIRYVGNRLHVFFHLAGTIFLHKSLLKEYLEKHCAHAPLGAAIFRDPQIGGQLCVVAWLGKIVTGSWMALMYSPMTERKHLEMVDQIKNCMEQITILEEMPEGDQSSPKDIFQKPLVEDDFVAALRSHDLDLDDNLLNILAPLPASFKAVLSRQCQWSSVHP